MLSFPRVAAALAAVLALAAPAQPAAPAWSAAGESIDIGVLAAARAAGLAGTTAPAAAATPTTHADDPADDPADDRRVLAISVDGLNPSAIRQLGHSRAPNFYRLLDQGASTLNARTEVEQTVTLPNHTSMLTGRRVDARAGGHGVTWDDERRTPATVQAAAGHPVSSVFAVVHAAGRGTALFSAKTKFSLYERSFGTDLDRVVIDLDNDRLATRAADDLVAHDRAFTFLHLSRPDLAGHATGFMSPAYVEAVRRTDAELGIVLAAIDSHPELRRHLDVILTADHGGLTGARSHSERSRLENYRIPFLAWGPGIARGDLYGLNRGDYRDPGDAQPSYDGTQPVRNGDVADLATSLLGLGAVPGSQLDVRQDLTVLR